MVSFPTQDEIDNLPFKIFNKSTSSPTLLIHNKNVVPQVVLKLWKKSDLPIYKALEYEKSVYSRKINPLIENNENAPFLKYIGEGNCANFLQIADYIGAKDEKAKNFLTLAFYIYEKVQDDFNYEILEEYKDMDVYKDYTEYGEKENIERIINAINYQCIILPFVNMIPFSEALECYDTHRIVDIFKNIMEGVFMLYRNDVSHNDLHDDNIMIEEDTDKVFIFDWDRSYCSEFGDNPMLDKNVCKKPCSSSQCNLFHRDGYCIDFYKILYYVLYSRRDWRTILENIGIVNVNYEALGTTLYDIIYKTIREHNNGFFNALYWDDDEGDEIKCSWLQDRDLVRNNGTTMRFLHDALGDYRIIYRNSLGEDRDELREIIPPDISRLYDRYIEAVDVVGEMKFGMLKTGNYPGNYPGKQKGKISDRKIRRKIKEPDINRLKNISHRGRTWKNFLDLKRLVNYISNGSDIEEKVVFLKNKKSPKPKSIVEIIMKNDRRKLEN
jgi:tRNA A-37 threonylcarbamoyl transferase component Bud32